MPTSDTITIRPIRDEELVRWFSAFSSAFYVWASDPEASAQARREHMDLARTLAAFDGESIVGTFRSFPARLTLPGGARIDTNAISAVSVRPTHRRRGLLSRMIADDMARAAARGDAASILIASEWPIYGRYGFGPATWQANWSIRPRSSRFEVDAVGSIEVIDVTTARSVIPDLYDRCAAAQPGEITRPDHRWDVELGIREVAGRPRWRGSIIVHRNAAGEPDGFARFHGEEKWEDMHPEHVLLLDELHAETLEAEIDLWRHLAQMDLTAEIRAEVRRVSEPMKWFLADSRVARVSGTADFLWLRILDVVKVLGARTYERDGSIVLEVEDVVGTERGPAAGRFRLAVTSGTATCAATTDPADLTIDVRALSAAALGGTHLRDAARLLTCEEHRPGALRDAEAMLMTADAPWCSTWF